MSSLAAARADNFYYDPLRFDPSKKKRGSANALANSHPLGERAKRIGEGILTIRFEMPYDSWCLGCNVHIARGVRYNVDKKKVGEYFTTPIYEFRMKCVHCDQYFVIKTDPKNADYEYVSGIRKKIKAFDPKDAETLKQLSTVEKEAIETNKLFKLEHMQDDERKAHTEYKRLEALASIQDGNWKDDYDMNRKLRAAARETRKVAHALEDEGRDRGYDFAMLPEATEDLAIAKMIFEARRGAGSAGEVAELVDAAVDHTQHTEAGLKAVDTVLPGFVRANTDVGVGRLAVAAPPILPPTAAVTSNSSPHSSKSAETASNSLNKHLKRVRVQQEVLGKVSRARLDPTHFKIATDIPPASSVLPPTGIIGAVASKLSGTSASATPAQTARRPSSSQSKPSSRARSGVTDLLLGMTTKRSHKDAAMPVRVSRG